MIGVICGHSHYDAYQYFNYDNTQGVIYRDTYAAGWVPAICVTCDSYLSRTVYGSNRKPLTQAEYETMNVVNRHFTEVGSIERHAFDSIMIDMDARRMYFTRIGSGEDLTLQY